MSRKLFIVALFALAGCQQQPQETDDAAAGDPSSAQQPVEAVEFEPSENYDTALQQATDTLAAAAELGHAWVTSDQLLADARAAHEAGDEATAIRHADEARIHAELAIQQAKREAATWQDNVIGNDQ
jgi:hypothetical protein